MLKVILVSFFEAGLLQSRIRWDFPSLWKLVLERCRYAKVLQDHLGLLTALFHVAVTQPVLLQDLFRFLRVPAFAERDIGGSDLLPSTNRDEIILSDFDHWPYLRVPPCLLS